MRAIDGRADPVGWARDLGIAREAVDLYLASEVIDLHIDSFIWHRVFGYDLLQRNAAFTLGTCLSQVDFPRVREAEISGATWVITTNPLRAAPVRGRVLQENLRDLLGLFASAESDFSVVRNAREYAAARRDGKHAAFIGVQGGNAFDHDLELIDRLPQGVLLRITLVHLSNSSFGTTSAPSLRRRAGGLTRHGADFVRKLNEHRILVDLAHASPQRSPTSWPSTTARNP